MQTLFVLSILFVLSTGKSTSAGETSSVPSASSPEDEGIIVDEKNNKEKKQYKIAIFAPYTTNSQVLFNKRVGEELMRSGHDVTIYMLTIFDIKIHKVDIDPRIRIVHVNSSFGFDGEQMMADHAKSLFNDLPIWSAKSRKSMRMFEEIYKSCGTLVKDKKFIAHIKESKYDIAFTHMYNYCPIGIIHLTKIPTWIWMSSADLTDNIAKPWECPCHLPIALVRISMMMDAGDKMNFIERTKSFIGHLLFNVVWKSYICHRMTANKETEIFRAEFGEDFPDLTELASKAPLVMVNSKELYDFARPTLSKIVNIGGVGIKSKDAKPLKSEFATLVDKAKGIVVMSFGSIAPMYLMPSHWKEAYFHAFAQFPNIQFFLRYENPDEIVDILPSNAYASKWLPQTDLLQFVYEGQEKVERVISFEASTAEHPKALGLISHGGYNSVQDALHAGVPILTTGLLGDQLRNARLVDRLGVGVNVHKTKMSKETMVAAIRRLVEDNSLKANAQRLMSMIGTKPVSAETLLVRWTEFLAQHKKLDNLVPYGTSLSFFVYHSLDVIAFLSVIIRSILALTFFIIRCSLRCCGFCRKNTTVDEMKKNQ